jgi:hypothetical protein
MTHCVLDHSCRTGLTRKGDDVIPKTKPVAITRIRTVHIARTKREMNRTRKGRWLIMANTAPFRWYIRDCQQSTQHSAHIV